MRRDILRLAAASLILLCGGIAGAAPAPAWTELSDLRCLALRSGFSTHQFSSFDRKGGNEDWGHFLKEEGNRRVLADVSGPGEIVRIWSANPSGTLRVFADGASQPVLAGPFAGLFDGKIPPVAAPLATRSSGGCISYWPIPFTKSVRIETVDSDRFYYHVTYRTWNIGAPTAAAPADAVRKAQSLWAQPGPLRAGVTSPDPLVAQGGVQRRARRDFRLRPGRSGHALKLTGQGYIYEMRFMLPAAEIQALRKTRLVIRWDGCRTPGVDAPLLDLFGSAFGLRDFKTLPIGRTNDGWYYLRLPMPFRRSAEINLVNQSSRTLLVHLNAGWVQGRLSPDALYYRTAFNAETTAAGRPHRILSARGEGQYVGVTMSMEAKGNWIGFLEGDEQVAVDGRPITDYHGTGTEDYFNSGWYFDAGPVAQPLHGCLVKDVEHSRISACRFHLTDRIPFTQSIDLNIEHGGTNDAPGVRYASVAHFYSASPGDSATPSVNASALAIRRIPVPEPSPAIALSRQPRTELSGGRLAHARWTDVCPGEEGGELLVFRPRHLGNAFTLRVPFPCGDKFSLGLWAARGPGMGRVRVSVDEDVVGVADLYSPEANHSAFVPLGDVLIPRGVHSVRIQAVGRNTASGGMTIAASHLCLGSASPFATGWQVLGPFAGGKGTALDQELIPESAWPDFSSAVSTDGREERWRNLQQKGGGMITVGDNPDAVWYLAAVVTAQQDLSTEMLIGCEQGKVFLNGQQVYVHGTERPAAPDQDSARVFLHKGENRLLLKLYNSGGPAVFSLRLRDSGGQITWAQP